MKNDVEDVDLIQLQRDFLHDIASPLMIALESVSAVKRNVGDSLDSKWVTRLGKAEQSIQQIIDKLKTNREAIKQIQEKLKTRASL